MENKNYYDILGIDKNASEDDIKKAYKKAAVKWHPDRWSTKSDSEKKNAEEKFKEIGEAYSVLSDPQKKQQYDMFGTVDGQMGGFNNSFNMNGFSGMDDIFDIFSGRSRGRRQPMAEPGQSIEAQVAISIEELFKGVDKEIDVNVQVRCEKCHGEGGTGVTQCPHCHGTGMITEVKQQGFMTMQTSHPCPHCHGTGKIVKEKCKECGGSGFKTKTRKVKVHFAPGVIQGQPQVCKGMGCESKNPKGQTGDLYVTPVYAFDQNKYRVQGKNVYELLNVMYYDCIVGKELNIMLPSGKSKTITIPKCSKNNTQITLYGEGINGGNYIFIINVVMPVNISNEEEKLLKSIQALHN